MGWALPWLASLPGSSGALAAELPLSRRVVILGDSLTAGFGVQRSEAYPALLQRKVEEAGLPYEVVGAGLSGDTTAGGLRRVAWVLQAGAAVCVVALGGNDGLRGVPSSETEANLRGIIRLIRAKSPRTAVVLAGMRMPANVGAAYAESFAAVFPKVAKEEGALLVPFLLEGVGGIPELNQPDLIHPNAKGQAVLAENVWRILRPLLEDLRRRP